MADNAKAVTQPPESSLARKALEQLVGEWDAEIVLPFEPSNVIRGRATFEWLEKGAFLVYRSGVPGSDFPTLYALIGCDDKLESYSMLYYDSRDVARIYQMSLDAERWKLWRDEPGFPQRFTGRFSDNGNTIQGAWEKASDGSHWEHDFDLTYRKVRSSG